MKNKKNNKKGFTLAELLIVVAIIAVLVAIAIPVFTAQLEKARVATEQANARSVYAEAVMGYMENSDAGHLKYEKTIDGVKYTAQSSDSGATWTVSLENKKSQKGPSSYNYGGSGTFSS